MEVKEVKADAPAPAAKVLELLKDGPLSPSNLASRVGMKQGLGLVLHGLKRKGLITQNGEGLYTLKPIPTEPPPLNPNADPPPVPDTMTDAQREKLADFVAQQASSESSPSPASIPPTPELPRRSWLSRFHLRRQQTYRTLVCTSEGVMWKHLDQLSGGVRWLWSDGKPFYPVRKDNKGNYRPLELQAVTEKDTTPTQVKARVDQTKLVTILRPKEGLFEKISMVLMVLLILGLGFLLFILWSSMSKQAVPVPPEYHSPLLNSLLLPSLMLGFLRFGQKKDGHEPHFTGDLGTDLPNMLSMHEAQQSLKYFVEPGKDTLDLLMRTILDPNEVKLVTMLLHDYQLYKDQEGLDLVETFLAARCAETGQSQRNLLMGMTSMIIQGWHKSGRFPKEIQKRQEGRD